MSSSKKSILSMFPRVPEVLHIALDTLSLNLDVNAALFTAMRFKGLHVTVTEKLEFAVNRLDNLTPEPKAVLIGDSAIVAKENAQLQRSLVEYAKGGGIVIHCCAFSSFTAPPKLNAYMKRTWDLDWKSGEYDREDSVVVPGGGHGMAETTIPACFSQKALSLTHVAHEDRVYANSVRELKGAQTAVAFTRVGQGYMGYIGDVNGEDGTTDVILAMIALAK